MKPTTIRLLDLFRSRRHSTSFIGLGRMGQQMAHNLFSKLHANDDQASFLVYDVIPDCARSFVENFVETYPQAKIAIAATIEEATVASQTIVTMLPSSPEVRQVYSEKVIPTLRNLGEDQVQDTLCIDSTTLDVSVARQVAADVFAAGAEMIDAPVSGGVAGAKAGTLSFLVGGPESSFKRSEPILTLMGQRIIHCGPSGAGLGAKICNNLVLGVQQIVVGEAMLLGQRLGLPPAVLASVINGSTGGCWASSVNNPVPSALPGKSPPCEREYKGGFATALMLKDMGLATDIGKQVGSPLPMTAAAEEIYSRIVKEEPSMSRKDFSSVYRFLESGKF